MTLSIKRDSSAPSLEGITAGKNYPAQGFTDGNVLIVNDDEALVPVGFKQIGKESCDWSLVVEKKAEKAPEKPVERANLSGAKAYKAESEKAPDEPQK